MSFKMLLIRLSLLGLMTSSLTAASEAANFDLPSATFRQYGCDEQCEQLFNLAEEQDRQLFGSDFDFDFYATAPGFKNSHSGELLKFEPINPSNLNITSGVTVYRFQYTSRALNGTFVPATGFIGLPDTSSRTDNKHPVIAFAHGTSGVFRGCPPSTTPTLADYYSWSLLVKSGYAVVAPDYAGLGNDYIEHQYLSFPAHANDLYYGMVAARQALPDAFTDEWMSVGHSQGGGASWKLSESPLHSRGAAGTYLGSVAIAPATKIFDTAVATMDILFQRPDYASYDIIYLFSWLAIALKRVFPRASVSFVAEKLQERISLATEAQSCMSGILSLPHGLKPKELITDPAWVKHNRFLRRWQDWVAPANGARAAGPLMIIQGLNDTAVLPEITTDSYDDTCRHGNEAHIRLYEGASHIDVFHASAPEWLEFLSNQFAQKKGNLHGACSSVTRDAAANQED